MRESLTPTLTAGDLVVMDHLPSPKVDGVRELIEAIGATLQYLPPYSPDLNPIAHVFSKLKVLLRTAEARSIEVLWNAIGRIINTVPVEECKYYFTHSG